MSLLSQIPFSLLELAPMREGQGAGETLRHSLDYAREADSLGFNRFWLAEHHNMEGIASAATSVLIGYIAGGTERIRVGSGGIMLPNHPPLVVAEQFGTLECLYPGRIDLGLGRAPGTDPETSRALSRDPMRAERFPAEVAELQRLLGPRDNNSTRVRAIPGEDSNVPIWLLGSSLFAAELAAQRGLPYAFAGHFAPRFVFDAIRLYKSQFRPSATLAKPYVMLGLPLVAAETDEQAAYIATSSQRRMLARNRGEPLWLRPPVEDMAPYWNEPEKASVNAVLGLQVMGGPATIRAELENIVNELQVDELMFTNDIYDPAQRLKALSILMSVKE